MKSKAIVAFGSALLALAFFSTHSAMAQFAPPGEQPAGPGMHAPNDVREPALLAMCRHKPAHRRFVFRGRAGPAPVPPFNYEVKAIPGVVAAGARWRIVFVANGNNADGLIGLPDGGIMLAQNDDSTVVKLSPAGKATTVYHDTDSGGTLAINDQGEIFVAERALMSSVWELAPKRKLLADSYDGESLDCLGGAGIDGVAALDSGGVYFSMNGLFYAAPDGHVTQYGQDVDPNDIALSPDRKTLYVGSGGRILAFDVGTDGALSHQRVFATIPGGGNDGGGVDADGRVYFEGSRPGVDVFSPAGTFLGRIATPFPVISTAFGKLRYGRPAARGALPPEHDVLYAVGLDFGAAGLIDEVMAIPTLAHGATP